MLTDEGIEVADLIRGERQMSRIPLELGRGGSRGYGYARHPQKKPCDSGQYAATAKRVF